MVEIESNLMFLDVQGFKSDCNKFIVKELCILFDKSVYLFLIKSPFSFNELPAKYKREAKWLEKNVHGLNWNNGTVTLQNVRENLKWLFCKPNIKVLVKGAEKLKWIHSLFNTFPPFTCINIEELGCSLQLKCCDDILTLKCPHHKYNFLSCAYKNVKM